MRTILPTPVERHPDGYVAYPLGLRGGGGGQGDTAEQALADVTSAIRFHVETFGTEVLDAFLAETAVDVT